MKTVVKSCVLTLVAGLLPILTGTSPAVAETKRDPRAVAVVQAMEAAVLPEGAWDKIAGLRFTQAYKHADQTTGEFHYTWDLKSGRVRVDGKGDDGGERIVIFDLPTRKGEGWVHVFFKVPPAAGHETDEPVESSQWFHPPGPPQKAYLKFGYEHYLTDTYWLLLPLKLKDPNVELRYVGEQELDGEPHDIVKAVFPQDLGLRTGDTYWLFINQKTHLIDRWDYPPPPPESDEPHPAPIKSLVRTKNPPVRATTSAGAHAPAGSGKVASASKVEVARAADKGASPAAAEAALVMPKGMVTWLWKGWKAFGPLQVSTLRSQPDTQDSVTFDVEILSSMPANTFVTPTKPHVRELADAQGTASK